MTYTLFWVYLKKKYECFQIIIIMIIIRVIKLLRERIKLF